MRTNHKILLVAIAGLLLACNQTRPGQNTTDAGTQQSDNTVNAEMEDNRTASDVDTVISPGSNAKDIKGEESTTGKTEPNTQIQSPATGNENKK